MSSPSRPTAPADAEVGTTTATATVDSTATADSDLPTGYFSRSLNFNLHRAAIRVRHRAALVGFFDERRELRRAHALEPFDDDLELRRHDLDPASLLSAETVAVTWVFAALPPFLPSAAFMAIAKHAACAAAISSSGLVLPAGLADAVWKRDRQRERAASRLRHALAVHQSAFPIRRHAAFERCHVCLQLVRPEGGTTYR